MSPRRPAARPKGVLGAEVWRMLIDAGQRAPTDRSKLAFLTMAIKPGIRAEFRSGDGVKTAVYYDGVGVIGPHELVK